MNASLHFLLSSTFKSFCSPNSALLLFTSLLLRRLMSLFYLFIYFSSDTVVFAQVLCVGNLYNPDVRYSFNIPIEEHREQFVWDPSGSWLECNRICQGETSAWHPRPPGRGRFTLICQVFVRCFARILGSISLSRNTAVRLIRVH